MIMNNLTVEWNWRIIFSLNYSSTHFLLRLRGIAIESDSHRFTTTAKKKLQGKNSICILSINAAHYLCGFDCSFFLPCRVDLIVFSPTTFLSSLFHISFPVWFWRSGGSVKAAVPSLWPCGYRRYDDGQRRRNAPRPRDWRSWGACRMDWRTWLLWPFRHYHYQECFSRFAKAMEGNHAFLRLKF